MSGTINSLDIGAIINDRKKYLRYQVNERYSANNQDLTKRKSYFETSRFVFAQSPYFSSWASKSNLDGAQEPKHAPDFSQGVLDKLERLDEVRGIGIK